MEAGRHIEYITHICNQRLYLLNQIRKQGLQQVQLLNVFQAIILSRILYASPAWYGYASDVHIDSIQKVLGKAKRWHIVNSDSTTVDLLRNNDLGLFHALKASNHCLNHLLAPKTELPIVWFFDLGAINLLCQHFNQNLQENHRSTALCSCIYNYSEYGFAPDIVSDLLHCCIIVFTNCIICIARIVTQTDCL